ncbi:hypothetical protein IEQ34_013373 [Dendrobium chrysotoxum]|uniref:Uncharacterized protein n=1 Tax=Dendrobium chrysotoxum TaxID=161865 RepID=A0AAV7GR65_DENCH|nr:hypothetical protein IEQ34_013373 [Dendrobium chrysotoxum]
MGKRPQTLMKRMMSLMELSPDLVAAASHVEIPPQPLAEDPRRDGKLPPSPASQRSMKRRCSRDPFCSRGRPLPPACGLYKCSLDPGFDTFKYIYYPIVDINLRSHKNLFMFSRMLADFGFLKTLLIVSDLDLGAWTYIRV